MCILALPVDLVGATQIFVAPDATKENQITIYSNAINNKNKGNSMILPVPNPDTIKFIDLSDYNDIFKDLSSCFKVYNNTRGMLKSMDSMDGVNNCNKLQVHNVGDYFASIAMSIHDLKMNINQNVFQIDSECLELLSKEYPAERFGFIVCKLDDNGKVKNYHPFAYSHKLEYDDGNRESGRLFITTKHYHSKGELTTSQKFHRKMFPEQYIRSDSIEHFDHDIYIYNGRTNKDNHRSSDSPDYSHWNHNTFGYYSVDNPRIITKIRSKIPFDLGEVGPQFEKHHISGEFGNIDLTAVVC